MYVKKPDWLKVKITGDAANNEVQNILNKLSLNTVCKEANCPNRMECFHNRTATFMILGKVCTRNCTFCNVTKGKTEYVDEGEPKNVAKAVKELNLKHVVVTSVTRDDLEDGGAQHFANVINEIRALNPFVTIEVLIPDFKGDISALKKVVKAKPNIINHNIETIPSLYPTVRPMAVYKRSIDLLKNVKDMDDTILTKSGIMVGLGETENEVIGVLWDLREVNCDILTIGQYIAPSSKHHPVIEYIHPDIFERYRLKGIEIGFRYVASSPLVRSSYHAGKVFEQN